MKINQELRPPVETSVKGSRQTQQGTEAFQTEFARQQAKLQSDIFQHLLDDIETQGEKLARLQTAQELQHYKRLVQRFVKEAVHSGMELKRSRSWNQQGRLSTLTVVEKIDAHLLDLTEAVLQKGESALDLLEKVGEIKGLLINLYT